MDNNELKTPFFFATLFQHVTSHKKILDSEDHHQPVSVECRSPRFVGRHDPTIRGMMHQGQKMMTLHLCRWSGPSPVLHAQK